MLGDGDNHGLASGYVNSLLLKMAIEIVDLPINSMVIFHSYVSLPEGTSNDITMLVPYDIFMAN